MTLKLIFQFIYKLEQFPDSYTNVQVTQFTIIEYKLYQIFETKLIKANTQCITLPHSLCQYVSNHLSLQVPLHLRTNWDSFYLEMLMIAGLVVYFLNFFTGRSKNYKLANMWYSSHKSLLEENFSLVGQQYQFSETFYTKTFSVEISTMLY